MIINIKMVNLMAIAINMDKIANMITAQIRIKSPALNYLQ